MLRGPRHRCARFGLWGPILLLAWPGPRVGYTNPAATIEPADADSAVLGRFTSIALDRQGVPWISYYDQTNGNLKCAHRSGGRWTSEAPDTTGDVGLFTSIALDRSDDPHISYYDATHGDLRYAFRSGGVWSSERVDGATTDVGFDTSIALDHAGRPCISYYDVTHGDLKFARQAGGAWVIEVVDSSAADVGSYTSLELDRHDDPCISYYDATHGNLVFARKAGGVWIRETADASADDVGAYTSLALDGTDRPLISYYDATHGDLKLARRTERGWSTETVDASADDVGLDTSIAMDAAGRVHISYYDDSAGDLRYARQPAGSAAGWEILAVVTGEDDVGAFSSIAVDTNLEPRFSCLNGTTSDLVYAETPAYDLPEIAAPHPAAGAGLTMFPNPSPGGVVHIGAGPRGADATGAVEILDAEGRRVRQLAIDATGRALWDGRDERGRPVPSGVHFVRTVTRDGRTLTTRRLVIVH